MRRSPIGSPLWIAFALVFAPGCPGEDDPPLVEADRFGRCASFDPLRQVFWGDLHVHTELSFDANTQGTRTTMADAYAFARGQPIGLQPYEPSGEPSRMAQIDRPLDFVLVSDHAEFLSTLALCRDLSSAAAGDADCVAYRNALELDADPLDVGRFFNRINGRLIAEPTQVSYPALCGPGDSNCLLAGVDVWSDVLRAADAAYDRTDSCQFTTFPGYEWTGGPAARNLHRNVLFKNASVPAAPIGYLDEPFPEGLWRRLDQECLSAGTGCDVLTIPHNSNLSEGIFFDRLGGAPIDDDYAAERAKFEPLIEIYQHKGASECLPGDSISDELCGFEILPFANLAATNLEVFGSPAPRGFLRSAYGEGLARDVRGEVNPFKHGVVAATDTHVSAAGFVNEASFLGHGGAGQANRFTAPEGFPDIEYLSPGGLTAVWAEENAREAVFAALKRKETFGTSGPRMVVRLFGGWDYPDDLCGRGDLPTIGYRDGVPMGGDLGPATSNAPELVVAARRDIAGAPLQRIQIVKGWHDGTDYRVEVFDVAGDRGNAADVDLATCAPRGTGAANLCAVWRDPSFDAAHPTYYYARVLENPTCRWTTQQCVRTGYDCDQPTRPIDQDCCDPVVGLDRRRCAAVDCADPDLLPAPDARCCAPPLEPTIQERAWTSPIWYRP